MRSASIFASLFAAAALSHPTNAGVISQTSGPDGSFDYATFDAAQHRVLITRGTGVMTFDTLDHTLTTLAAGARTHSAVLLPRGRVLITNGSANTATIANGQTGAIEATIAVGTEPDAAVYDPASRSALVMNAHSGDISMIDPVRGRETSRIAVGGALEFAVADGAGTVFVNVEDHNQVAVIDTRHHAVRARFALAGCEGPTALGYVQAYRLLIVACANGHAKLISGRDGHEVADLPIGPHPDQLVYDARRHLAFIPTAGSATEPGEITVVRVTGPTQATVDGRIATGSRARTIAEDPDTGRLYLPTADYALGPGGRPAPVAGTFRILTVEP